MNQHVVGRACLVVLSLALFDNRLEAQSSSAGKLSGADYFARLKEADALVAKQQLGRAVEQFVELARQNPDDATLSLRAGECYAALGRREEAIPCFERAYAGGVSERYALAYRLAQLCAQLDRRDAALDWLARALEHRYVNRAGIAADAAFANLRELPRFRELAGLLPAGEFDRVAGWRYDLAFYGSEVRRMHVGPGRPGESADFQHALAALAERVPTLSDEQVYLELQRLMVRLGDGHSNMYPMPSPRLSFLMLPIQLYSFSDGWFVVGASGEAAELAGCELLAIGPKKMAEVEPILETLVSRDNAMGVRWIGPRMLANFTLLHALGLATQPDRVELTVRAPGGAERKVTVRAEAMPPHDDGRLGPPPGTDAEHAALWLRRPHDPFWFHELTDRGVLYAQLNQINDASPRQTLESFAHDIRETLSESETQILVLDLRHNNGGNNFLVWPIVRLLAWFEESSPRHRTFVLTGRNTFSAAQNCLNQIHRATHAIIAGEPSSSKPNFTGESTQIRLPWSGLRASISSRWWQDSYPEDERVWIAPEIPVALSSQDYFLNRDPVMTAVLAVAASE